MATPVNVFFLIFFFILGLLLYHAIFDVWYLNFQKAITGEIIGALIFSIVLTAIAIKWWFIPVIILVAIGLGVGLVKCKTPLTRGIVIGAFCIAAIVVAVNGIKGNKELKEQELEKEQQEQQFKPVYIYRESNEANDNNSDVASSNGEGMQYRPNYSILYDEPYLTENQDGCFFIVCEYVSDTEVYVDVKWLDPNQAEFLPVSFENTNENHLRNSAENPDLYQNESGSLTMRLISDFEFELTERDNNAQSGQPGYKNTSGMYHASSSSEVNLKKNEAFLSNAGVEGEDEYILPEADSRYYSQEELEQIGFDKLRLARNEILARHGRIFESEDLNSYYSSKSWYQPRYTSDEFDPQMDQILNAYEKANIEEIKKLENGEGANCLYRVTVDAPDGYVNLREGAGTNYNVVKEVVNGVVLNVYAESSDGNWLQTEYQGASGWVATSQVKK